MVVMVVDKVLMIFMSSDLRIVVIV